MSISFTSRTFSLLAAFTLAGAGLSACSVPGISASDPCAELHDATDSLASALEDVINGEDAAASFKSALDDMEAVNEDLPDGEVKDAWEEVIVSVEDLIPLYEQQAEYTGETDPEALIEKKDERMQHAEEMQGKMEVFLQAQSDLVEVCPELGNDVGNSSSDQGDSSDSEGRRE